MAENNSRLWEGYNDGSEGKDSSKIKEIAKSIYNHSEDKSKRGLVTVIVGAGASRSSPTTEELIKELIPKLGKEVFNTNAHVHFGKSVEECTLEELFSIFAKIKGEKALHEFLHDKKFHKKIISVNDYIRPTAGYEFLSHLVHHKLVDIIITTNFDEELEISLDDEIGRENYKIVKSLSEFDVFMEMRRKNSAFEKPVLFKVHGTISYPRTLRPTIESVQKFEKEKFEVISEVLRNTEIFIIVGYGSRDTDFRNALVEALRKRSDSMNIYWVHKREETRQKYKETSEEINKESGDKGEFSFIIKDSDEFFEELAEEIEEIDKNKKIPTIARHKIRNLILRHLDVKDISKNKFYLEVIIFAVKAKGLFSIDALTDCARIQRYYRELINAKNANCSPHELLKELEKKGLIKQVKGKIGIYCVPVSQTEEIRQKIIDFFNLHGKLKGGEKLELREQLKKLEKEFDVDIVEPDASVYLMFKNPKPIRDHGEWVKKTRKLVEDAKELKIIAQTGEWMTKGENRRIFENFLKNGGEIKLITCEKFKDAGMHSERQEYIEQELEKMVNEYGGRIKMKYLSWEEISEHIRLNDKSEGIYMKRMTKSPTVAPVWVEEREDYELLEKMFDYYWDKAQTRLNR